MTLQTASAIAHKRANADPDQAYFVLLDTDDFGRPNYIVITYRDYIDFPYSQHQVHQVIEFSEGEYYYE